MCVRTLPRHIVLWIGESKMVNGVSYLLPQDQSNGHGAHTADNCLQRHID